MQATCSLANIGNVILNKWQVRKHPHEEHFVLSITVTPTKACCRQSLLIQSSPVHYILSIVDSCSIDTLLQLSERLIAHILQRYRTVACDTELTQNKKVTSEREQEALTNDMTMWWLLYERDLSSSLADFAARSSPVGSKLLHLSLGFSPNDLSEDPPSPSGVSASSVGGLVDPLPQPKSHDMITQMDSSSNSPCCSGLKCPVSSTTTIIHRTLNTTIAPCVSGRLFHASATCGGQDYI